MTEPIMRKLGRLIEDGYGPLSRDREHLESLERKLAGATVLDAAEMPPDAVTLHSLVRVRDLDSGDTVALTLVYPEGASVPEGRISVLAPMGTALLGHREGDEIEWRMPGGVRRFRILRVVQPSDASAREAGVMGRRPVPEGSAAAAHHGAPSPPDFRNRRETRRRDPGSPVPRTPRTRASWQSA